jgi:hypothetical protein
MKIVCLRYPLVSYKSGGYFVFAHNNHIILVEGDVDVNKGNILRCFQWF